MKLRAVLLCMVVLAGASCLQAASPPPPSTTTTTLPPVPLWVPSGPINPAPNRTCKSILIVGDSVAGQTEAVLASVYQANGYCVTLEREAVAGTSPAFYSFNGPTTTTTGPTPTTTGSTTTTWTQRLQVLLTGGTRYDAVVAFFQGNGTGSSQDADAELQPNATETVNMIDETAAAGVPMYWTYPMLSAAGCLWTASLNTNGYEAYREWVDTQLPALRPGVVRINANVLTPNATLTRRGPNSYSDTLQFPTGSQPVPAGGTKTVRLSDCLHLAGPGPDVAAYEIVHATQGLWTVPELRIGTTPD
jgi:hypothetical protein